jgi:hypothetical protein
MFAGGQSLLARRRKPNQPPEPAAGVVYAHGQAVLTELREITQKQRGN